MVNNGILFFMLACALSACVSDNSAPAQLVANADDPTNIVSATTDADAKADDPADVITTPVSPTDIVCRNERSTGTHMVKRVCYSRAALDAEAEASRDWLRSNGAKGGPRRVIDDADPRRR